MSYSLFISDLHLSAERPQTTDLFLQFTRSQASECAALYILGDLFEYWAGDDDLGDVLSRSVVEALRKLSEHGTRVYFMHGNRDFLVGTAFAATSGAVLLPDPTLIDLHGRSSLLMHGDLLCTDDVRYQQFRKQVRDPGWQAGFLAKSLAERKRMIDDLRKMSEQEKGDKSAQIMDVNLDTVVTTLRAHGYPRLIHGHTHRPARHAHRVDAHACERWVLPDWYERGGYLKVDASGCAAIPL